MLFVSQTASDIGLFVAATISRPLYPWLRRGRRERIVRAPSPLAPHQHVGIDGRLEERDGRKNHPGAGPSAVVPHFCDVVVKAMFVVERRHCVNRASEIIARVDVINDCRSEVGVCDLGREYLLGYCSEKAIAIALDGVDVVSKDMRQSHFVRAWCTDNGVGLYDQREWSCDVPSPCGECVVVKMLWAKNNHEGARRW